LPRQTPQAVASSGHALALFGRQHLDPYEKVTWAEFWTRQRGPKLWLNLKGSRHDTFTDFAPLVRHHDSSLLSGPSPSYPEVVFTR
jgi:hypothetical protein